jgi:glycosyltransferase involved in cell wall biosynthesis
MSCGKGVRRGCVALSANASWNVVNFRVPVVRALQEAGFAVAVIAPPDAYTPAVEALGATFIPIAIDQKGLSPWRDFLTLRQYWRALRRLRPKAYLSYTPKPNIYGAIAARLLGVPVVANVSGLGTAFIRTSWLTSLVKLLYRLAFARASVVFFQNDEDAALFLESRLVPPGALRRIPGSGVDLDRFKPQPAPANERFTFLYVGRLLRDKGIEELVAAARIVRQERPDTAFRLVGAVDSANRTAIPAERVAAWAGEGLIEHVGSVSDVRPYLAAADCVVLPSYREGLPRSLTEAAAMGKPLIATEVPGCRSVVDDGENGFLCEVRDAGSLAAAMLRMLSLGTEARAAMGAASRDKAVREFGEERIGEIYRAAIADAIAGASRQTDM